MQKKFLLFPDSTNLKPAGTLSGRTVHDCLSVIESLAAPVLPHCGHLRFSIQWSRVVIVMHRVPKRSYVVRVALRENKRDPSWSDQTKPRPKRGIEAGQVGGVLTRASYGGA